MVKNRLFFYIFLFSFFLHTIGCSGFSTAERNIASISLCEQAYLGEAQANIRREDRIVEKFYLKNPNTDNIANYQINVERTHKYIINLKNKYKNEIHVETFGQYDGHELLRIDIPGWGNGPKKRVIITAGVHGNESAGVGSVINLFERIIHDPTIRNNYEFVVIPMMNPGGLAQNTRRIRNGMDLNRTFPGGKSQSQQLTELIRKEFKGEKFDLGLDLHEAPLRDKFFIIKNMEDDQSLTSSVVGDFSSDLFVTSKDGQYPGFMYKAGSKDGKPIKEIPKNISYTLYGPGEVSSNNKGTVKSFFANELKAEYSYTVEAPGQYDLADKVEIYTDLIEGYLKHFLDLK